MGKATQRKTKAKPVRMLVTTEATLHGDFISVGMAQRRVPVIESMAKRGQVSDATYRALAYYRDQASLAERSPVKSGLDFSVRGGERGPSVAITSAMLETARIERDLGALLPIARAVAVNDTTLTDWCVSRHGGRERYDGRGRFVAIVPKREKEVMAIALMELRMAAHRIVR